MSSGKTFISLDALGGDNSPSVVLDGAKLALESDSDLCIDLCGPKEIVEPFAKENDRVRPVVTTQSISMSEHPANAVRKKRDSSIVVGCKRVKEGLSDGFFSAGSTGACLAAATLFTGRIKGVKRPMLALTLPTIMDTKVFFGDVGANADCKPEYILQFAAMAKAYMNSVEGVTNPKVALLNIGEESTKGSQDAQEAYKLLSEKLDYFAGNAESKAMLSGDYDAVVTDGFSGNITLKTIEGTAKMVIEFMKDAFMSSTKSKIGALLAKPSLASMKDKLNPDVYGCALLFGVNGACTVGHGSSNSKAIRYGVLKTAEIARANVPSIIKKEILKLDL